MFSIWFPTIREGLMKKWLETNGSKAKYGYGAVFFLKKCQTKNYKAPIFFVFVVFKTFLAGGGGRTFFWQQSGKFSILSYCFVFFEEI